MVRPTRIHSAAPIRPMKKAFNSVFSNPQVGPFLQIMVIFWIATGIQNGAFNNYLHEVLQISRMERGIIELPRELPGLLLFLIIAGRNYSGSPTIALPLREL